MEKQNFLNRRDFLKKAGKLALLTMLPPIPLINTGCADFNLGHTSHNNQKIPLATDEDYSIPDEDFPDSVENYPWYQLYKERADLCWAATASIALFAGGYINNMDKMFREYKKNFPDKGNSIANAFEYYFEKNGDLGESIYSKARRENRPELIQKFIQTELFKGKQVMVGTKDATTGGTPEKQRGHIVNVWGYCQNCNPDLYTLKITDSDYPIENLTSQYFTNQDGTLWKTYLSPLAEDEEAEEINVETEQVEGAEEINSNTSENTSNPLTNFVDAITSNVINKDLNFDNGENLPTHYIYEVYSLRNKDE